MSRMFPAVLSLTCAVLLSACTTTTENRALGQEIRAEMQRDVLMASQASGICPEDMWIVIPQEHRFEYVDSPKARFFRADIIVNGKPIIVDNDAKTLPVSFDMCLEEFLVSLVPVHQQFIQGLLVPMSEGFDRWQSVRQAEHELMKHGWQRHDEAEYLWINRGSSPP